MERGATEVTAKTPAPAAGEAQTAPETKSTESNSTKDQPSNLSSDATATAIKLLTEAGLALAQVSPLFNTARDNSAEKYLPAYEQFEQDQKLDKEALKRLQTLLLETIPKDDMAKYQKDFDALKGEQFAETYGETTRRLFTELVRNLETKVLPEYLRQLQQRELTVPVGAPQFLAPRVPAVDGKMEVVDLNSPSVNSPNLQADLKFDPSKPPTAEDIKRINDVYNWLLQSRNLLAQADGRTIDNLLIRQIQAEGLPATWLPKEGEDRDKWRTGVATLLDATFQTRKYAEEVKIINEVRIRSGQTPLPYPPAVERVDEKGNIVYRSDFPPKDPRIDSSAKFLNDLRAWQDNWAEVADFLALKVAVAKANPATLLTWADLPMQDKQAVFDKDGKFVDFVKDGSYTPKDGETVKKFNLLESKFEVSTRTNDKGETEIVVDQTIQALDVPWYGYQNSVSDPVGQPFKKQHVFKPDEFVPVQSNNGLMLVQAKDLERFMNGQKLNHYVQVGISVTADIGMLLLLGPEVKGLQLAYGTLGKEALEIAAKKLATEGAAGELTALTSSEVLLQAGKTTLRAIAAASGILNNAGAQDTMWGRMLLEFRGLYYMTDMGAGLLRYPLLNPGEKFTKLIMEGSGSNLLKLMNTTGQKLLKIAEPAMVITSGQDLLKRIGGLLFANSENPLDKFKDPVDKRVTPVTVPEGDGTLKATPDMLTRYQEILARAATGDTKSAIDTIFDTTKKLLAGTDDPDNAAKRKAYIDELLQPERFSEEQIRKFNQMIMDGIMGPMGQYGKVPITEKELAILWKGRLPTDAELKELYPNGDKPMWLRNPYLSQQMIAEAQRMKMAQGASENPELRIARRIAALALSAGPDGKLPESLSTGVWGTTTEWGMLAPRDTTKQDLNFQKMQFQVTTKELIENLKTELSSLQTIFSPTDYIATAKNGDGLVIGDLLMNMGLTTKEQHLHALQNIIESKGTTKQDKMDALLGNGTLGFGTTLSALIEKRLKDAANLQPTNANFGSDTADFLATLTRSASNASEDPDVRAASAILLFLAKSDISYQQKMLPRINDLWQQSKDKPAGTFAEGVALALRELSMDPKSSPAQLINAGKALMALGGDNNKLAAAQGLITAASAAETVYDMNSILKSIFEPGQAGDEASIFEVLQKKNPEFAASFLNDTLSSIDAILQNAPLSTSNVKKNIPALIETANKMSKYANPEQLDAYTRALKNMYYATTQLPSNEELEMKRFALLAISQIEGEKSEEFMRSIVTSGLEVNPAIRVLALAIMDGINQQYRNNHDQFRDLLRTIDPNAQTDPVYRQLVQDLYTKYGITEVPTEGDIAKFISNSSITETDKKQMAEWVKKFFPLLDTGNYERYKKEAGDSIGWLTRLFSSEQSIKDQVAKLMEPIDQGREVQFRMLLQQAFETSTDPQAIAFTNQAKQVLFSIMMYNQPDGAADGKGAVPADWRRRAAEALVATMAPGERGQAVAKGYISLALQSGTLPPDVQQILIAGWIANAKPQSALSTTGPIGSNSSYTEYIAVLNKALELAQKQQGQQPSEQLSKLIATIEAARNEGLLVA